MSPKCVPGRGSKQAVYWSGFKEALLVRREMIFQSAKETGLWSSHFHPRFPSSFPTLRSVFACVAVRSVYGLLIFLLPRASPRSPLACHEQPFLPLFRDISHPLRSFTRVCWSSQGKKHKSRRDGGRTQAATHVFMYSMLFLKICFSPLLLLLLYVLGMLHRCSYEFMKKIPFGFMYVWFSSFSDRRKVPQPCFSFPRTLAWPPQTPTPPTRQRSLACSFPLDRPSPLHIQTNRTAI